MSTTKKRTGVVAAVLLSLALSACNQLENMTLTPEHYFDRAVLSTNQINSSASRYFRDLIQRRDSDSLMIYDEQSKQMVKTDSAEAFVRQSNGYFSQNVQKVADLPAADDAQAMVAQSLKVFRDTQQVYDTDYIEIARQIDAGAAPAEIEQAVAAADAKLAAVEAERLKLVELAKPYAEKHKINVKW